MKKDNLPKNKLRRRADADLRSQPKPAKLPWQNAPERLKELETIVNRSPAIVFLWRAAAGWPVEFVSDNIKQFGYSPADFTSGEVPYARIIHPHDLERVAVEIAQASQDERDEFVQEYRIVTQSGAVCWVDDRTWVRRDARGVITHYQGIVMDITARKLTEESLNKAHIELERRAAEHTAELMQANAKLKDEIAERKRVEEALRESEKRYRSMFEDSPISLWEEDFSHVKQYIDDLRASGITDFRAYFESHPEAVAHCTGLIKVLDVNKATLTLVGARSKEELLVNLSDVLAEEALPVVREEIISLAKGYRQFESEEVNRTLFTREARWINLKINVVPGYESSLGKVLVSATDITERKRAEEALRESETRYHSIIEDQTELICRYLPDGRLSFVNEAYARYYGETAQKLINTNFLPYIPEPDLSAIIDRISEITLQEPAVTYEHRIIKPDGEVRWQRWTHRGVYDANGKLIEHQAVGADITERKRAEEELHRYLSELKVLYDNGLALSSLLEPREIGKKIIETLSRNLSWHHIVIRLRRGKSDDLELIAFNQPNLSGPEAVEAEKRFSELVSRIDQGLSGWCVRTGQAIRTGDVREQSHYVDTYSGIRSGIYMPLKVGEKTIGCISVESEDANAFTEQDERLLATLAAQTAIAFENARLYQNVQQELRERQRAEAALAKEKEFTETALDSQRDTFFVFEPVSGKAIRWNKIFRDITGYTDEEIASLKSPDAYCDPDDLKKAASLIDTVLRKGSGRVELPLICKDGRRIPIEYEASFVHNQSGKTKYIIAIGRDISERKRAEEQIQFLAKFPAEDPNPVLRVTQEGVLLYVNEAGLRLLPQWNLQIGGIVPSMLRDAISQSMKNETTQTFDIEHGDRLFAFYVAPILSAGYANLYGHDITESRQVKALQDAEARYRILFEQSPYGVLLADLETKTIEANEIASQQLGYTREEFINLKVSDYEASDNPEQIAQRIQKIIREGSDEFETLHRTKGGKIRNVHVWIKTLHLNERILFYTIVQDITERRQAEEELKNAHKQLERSLMFNEALLSAIPTPVFYKDKEGRYLGCNSAFTELTGISPDQLKGKTAIELWPSENAEVYHKKDLELMHKSERQMYEFKVRDKDGVDRPVIFAKDVFLDENKQVAGIVGAFLDITERKRMEEANEAYNHEITLLEERQRIASDLHDAVSQTLFSARLTAEMLLRQPDRQADAFTQSLMDLNRLVRSASGEIRLILVELRNNALLNVSLDSLLANLIDSGMARTNANLIFQCYVEDLVLPAKIKLAFYRIAQEATSNAIKHAKPDNIQCILRDNEMALEMLIQDDGTGFSMEKVSDDHFGLQIMRERAEQAGLKLTITSQLNQGTAVAVYWEKE